MRNETLISAGITSPRRIRIISPFTNSIAGSVLNSPSLRTLHCGANCERRAAIAFPALCSSKYPITAFKTKSARISFKI